MCEAGVLEMFVVSGCSAQSPRDSDKRPALGRSRMRGRWREVGVVEAGDECQSGPNPKTHQAVLCGRGSGISGWKSPGLKGETMGHPLARIQPVDARQPLTRLCQIPWP